ncbi:MAG: glucose-6-phosphate isomerase [Rickettsiaceae bacterium]|jgi:glucose-6-phosphate isomerase|nr:glucose-6-phosphate isomerase [Rickettsiaceae bacterium]
MEQIVSIFSELKEEFNSKKLPFLDLEKIDRERIKTLTLQIQSKFKTLLIVGTGASVINTRALISCLTTIEFDIRYLDNLDPVTAKNTIKDLDQTNTAVLVISKSGSTNETIALFNYLTNSVIGSDNLFIITEDKESELFSLGKKFNAQVIEHSKEIGGRFATLTEVGILAASIAGLDIDKFVSQAHDSLNRLFNTDSELLEYVEWIISNIEHKRNCLIIIYYGDQLAGLYEWVRQMYAESLGKKNFGFTPIMSRGTIDQHSQLQLYLDGPDDKFYELISLDNSTILHNPEEASLNSLFNIHANSTYQALLECKRPVKFYGTTKPYTHVTSIIIKTMLAIIIIAKLKNIDPFDQPAVEIGKKYIKALS